MNSGGDARRMNAGRRGVPPRGRPAPPDARRCAHRARFLFGLVGSQVPKPAQAFLQIGGFSVVERSLPG